MTNFKRKLSYLFMLFIGVFVLVGCTASGQTSSDKEIIRIGHNQSQNHPTHIGMQAFEDYIESELGDQYDVQIFANELLGTQTDMVQSTQTGAIDITVASNSIMETYDERFQILNLPYLFETEEQYHAVMDDDDIVGSLFKGTADIGFETVAWLDAGARNFYLTSGPVEEPSDLQDQKVRVQQSPTNVRLMELFGGSATPMGFGEVYTALQSGIINGAENNELSLTENGHGELVDNYSYTMHQRIPDLVLANTDFLNNMNEEEKAIFEEGFQVMEDAQHEDWQTAVDEAREQAANEMNVEFNYPDLEPFREAQLPLHEEVLEATPSLRPMYEQINNKIEEVNSGESEE